MMMNDLWDDGSMTTLYGGRLLEDAVSALAEADDLLMRGDVKNARCTIQGALISLGIPPVADSPALRVR